MVLDASAAIEFLLNTGPGSRLAARLVDEREAVCVAHLIDLENRPGVTPLRVARCVERRTRVPGVGALGSLLIAVDIFRIDLKDRLGVTGLFALEPGEVAALLAEGITSAANLANFRFFANDFETRTQGMDVVASWRPAAWGGSTSLDLALNLTRTKIMAYNPATLDARRIRELRDALPGMRWNASIRHEMGRVRLLARLRYFDGWWARGTIGHTATRTCWTLRQPSRRASASG